MSKTLEKLRDIRTRPFNWQELIEVCDEIEKELERLEQIDNAKPITLNPTKKQQALMDYKPKESDEKFEGKIRFTNELDNYNPKLPNEALECCDNLIKCFKTDKLGYAKMRIAELNTIKQALIQTEKNKEILNILKKYAKNDGWSNGWVIEFWNMKPREIKKVCAWLEKDKSE